MPEIPARVTCNPGREDILLNFEGGGREEEGGERASLGGGIAYMLRTAAEG